MDNALPSAAGTDLEFVDQHFLDVDSLAAGGAGRQFEFRRREHRVGHQMVVFCFDCGNLLALAQCHRHALRQLLYAFLDHRRKRGAGLVVDDLDDADQVAAVIQNRRDQHLLGAVARALVHFLQKTQLRAEGCQFLHIIDILDVEHFFMHCRITGNALFGNRQFEILEGVQAGFDF